jgi:hypothetical protein
MPKTPTIEIHYNLLYEDWARQDGTFSNKMGIFTGHQQKGHDDSPNLDFVFRRDASVHPSIKSLDIASGKVHSGIEGLRR